MATFPTNVGKKTVTAKYQRNSAMSVSPYNGTQQVYSWPMNLKVVDITFPPMTQTQADNFTQFIDDVNGHAEVFNMDLSDAYPHETGITAVSMRLANPDVQWDINTAIHYGITLTAMEAI